MSPQLVAHGIAETVRAEGVGALFLLTGGDQALWIALRDHGVRLLLARSEQGAVYMADGYARAAGRPALTYGQHGPGAANVAAALSDAWWGGSPVVALTSSVPIDARSGYPYQFLDQQVLFGPMTKWQAEAMEPASAEAIVRSAIRVAAAAPTGPVHLDLPRDLIRAARSPDEGSLSSQVNDPQPALDVAIAESFVEELSAAERPVILAGSGVVRGAAWDQLHRVAEALQVPVATTPGGKGAFVEDHPLAIGVAGRYSRKVANDLVEQADVVLALGTRLGALSTIDGRVPGPSARILHVDIDRTVFGAIYPDTVGLEGDIGAALGMIHEAARDRPMRHSGWRAEVSAAVEGWRQAVDRHVAAHRGDGLHPAAVVRCLRAKLDPADVLVADTGYMAAWASALFPVRAAGRNVLRAAGSLGWAVPAALGASVAVEEKRVACITGDGGVGYNLMELETAARLEIPALIIVLNNRSLAFEYHEQRHQWERVIEEANDYSDVDYAAIARDLGAGGRRVTRLEELEPAIAEGLASDRPWLLDVIVDKELVAPVTNFESVVPRVI